MIKTLTTLSIMAILALGSITSASAESSKNLCTDFDKITIKLSLAKDRMGPPLSLEEIMLALGASDPTISTITSYSWLYKNRVLLVVIDNGNIINRILTGTDDGSPTSRKMEQIYAELQSATSVWFIKNIETRLGKAVTKTNKQYRYNWQCGNRSIKLTTDQDNQVIATKTV